MEETTGSASIPQRHLDVALGTMLHTWKVELIEHGPVFFGLQEQCIDICPQCSGYDWDVSGRSLVGKQKEVLMEQLCN